MVDFTCQDCTHFRQHYVIDIQRATPVDCGHCTYPHLKNRKPQKTACQHFLQKAEQDSLPSRAAVLNYLTVDAIQRIFELTLPPEIESFPKQEEHRE